MASVVGVLTGFEVLDSTTPDTKSVSRLLSLMGVAWTRFLCPGLFVGSSSTDCDTERVFRLFAWPRSTGLMTALVAFDKSIALKWVIRFTCRGFAGARSGLLKNKVRAMVITFSWMNWVNGNNFRFNVVGIG